MKYTFHECKCKSFALKSNHRTAASIAKLSRLIPENGSRDIHVSQNCKCIASPAKPVKERGCTTSGCF